MRIRRKAREYALQMLFQADVGGQAPARFEVFWSQWDASPDARLFAEEVVRGVEQHADEIDAVLQRHTQHWAVERMATVDRNVLRIAVYELLHREDVPTRVVLNEAIDIAKKYGSEESGRFVNGVLDDVLKSDPAVSKRMSESEPAHASHLRK